MYPGTKTLTIINPIETEKTVVKVSKRYYRPTEVETLLGDSSKAKEKLGWSAKTSFEELVRLMVDSDLDLARKEKVLFENGMLKPTWEHPSS